MDVSPKDRVFPWTWVWLALAVAVLAGSWWRTCCGVRQRPTTGRRSTPAGRVPPPCWPCSPRSSPSTGSASDKPAVRIGGLTDLERLAQTHPELRQTVVDCRMDHVDFRNAHIHAHARFSRATFGWALFTDATFAGDADFAGVVSFVNATFTGDAGFSHAAFSEGGNFDGATFSRHAFFTNATFSQDALFSGTVFTGSAVFRGVTFDGPLSFEGTRVLKPKEAHLWPVPWRTTPNPDDPDGPHILRASKA